MADLLSLKRNIDFHYHSINTYSDSLLKSRKRLNFKMSNINMNIFINFLNTKNKSKDGLWIEKSKLGNYIIPTFTKKIFESVKYNL